jgi:hypothetical protein
MNKMYFLPIKLGYKLFNFINLHENQLDILKEIVKE